MDKSHTGINLSPPEHELFQYDRFVTAEGRDVPIIEFGPQHLLSDANDEDYKVAIIDRYGYIHAVPIDKKAVGIESLVAQAAHKIKKLEDSEEESPWTIFIFLNEKTQAGRILRITPEVDVDVFHVKKFLKHFSGETVRSED